MVHNNTAYFSQGRDVYSYTEDKWSKLKPCIYAEFSMAVVDHKLTTIGGKRGSTPKTTLLSLSESSSEIKWKKRLPSMLTARVRPAAVTTSTHLVVAGGSTVEVLNLHTLERWESASSLPGALAYPNIALCGEHVYLSGEKTIFSCSAEELVKSCKPSAGDSVWTRLPDTPTCNTTLATLRGRVLTIGGSDDECGGPPTGAIHCYDRRTNSWSAIGEMPTPRYGTLVAVLPSNELVVVGGYRRCERSNDSCQIAEIARDD